MRFPKTSAATLRRVLLAALLALPAGAAFAVDDDEDEDDASVAASPALRADVERRVRTYRAVSLAHRLDLDEKQALAMSAVMQRYDASRREIREELFEHMKVLRQAARGEALDDDVIEAAVTGALDARARLDALRQEEAQALMADLDPVRQAQLIIFFREFPREIRRLMREEGGERRPGRRGPPGGRRGHDGPPGR